MSNQKTLADTFISEPNPPQQDPIAMLSPGDLIIFPTTVLSNHYSKELNLHNIPHNPDQISTLSDFCRNYHADHGTITRVISDGQAHLLLATTLERIKADIPFFFNQGRPSSGTIKDLLALRTIVSQRSINIASHPLVSTSEKCRQISRALDAYNESLAKNHLLDSPALIEWTIQDLTTKTGFIFENVRMHRLFDVSPRERCLILAIRDHAKTFRYEYLRGSDPTLFSPPDWVRPEELVALQPIPEYESRSDIFTKTPEPDREGLIQARVYASEPEELESIAEEICTLKKAGIPLEEIAITFPNIASVLPMLHEVLHDFGIPFHAYVGEPLIREPIIGFLLLFPSLVADRYPRESVIELLRSPYFNIRQPDLPPMSVALFDLVVRTAGIEGGYSWEEPLRALANLSDDGEYSGPRIPDTSVDAVLTWITKIQKDCNQFTGNLTPAGYSKIWYQLCRQWMRPEFLAMYTRNNDQILTREVFAFRQFQGCLTRLSSMVASKETIDLSSFRRFLTYILQEPVYLTEDRGGVRIMGLRQTVGMDFSCLFLGGLIEDEIPNPSTRFPLLTSPESEQLGGRKLDEVIRDERYYFISSLSAGKQVWLSASKTSGERNILSSSFFERVKKGKNTPDWGREITHSKKRAAIRAGKKIKDKKGDNGNTYKDILTWLPADQTYGSVATRILVEDWHRTGIPDSVYDGILTEDREVTGWLSDPTMFGPARIWSATQLETYATCPFRFFLERVVRVSSFPDVDLTLSPAQRGTLIHETLCTFYSQWCANSPRRITSRDQLQATSLLVQIGTEMSQKYRYQSPVWHATVASLLGFEDLPGLYKRFIDHETECEGSLRPDTFECSLCNRLDTPGEETGYVLLDSGTGEPVRLRGRIDRIDTTPEGHFAIIDYKTGSTYPSNKRIIEGKALQLPLYLLAVEQMHQEDADPWIGIGGSYLEISRKIKQTWALLDPEKKNEAGVPESKGTRDFRDVVHGALTAAQRNISAIRNGLFPLPLDDCKSARYCPYSGICRLDLFRLEQSAEEGGEPDDRD